MCKGYPNASEPVVKRGIGGLLRGIVLLGLVLTAPFEARAQVDFAEAGSFRVTKPCRGFTSFRKQTGAVDLEVEKTYVARGENRAMDASHVHIERAGKMKWVSLECGDYEGGRPAFSDQSRPVEGQECLPFFDNEDNPVSIGFGGNQDITPQAPEISAFGAAVNRICGSPGKRTTEAEFRQILRDEPQQLADLMAFTGGKVFADRPVHQDTGAYLDDLAEAWYAVHAFDHIFCGEPEAANQIGGLHFHGRYQQLQASGEACRLPNHGRNEVVPGSTYTMGVRMKRADGGSAQFPVKGYGLTFSAGDILKVVTRAFAENPTASTGSTGCILAVNDEGTEYETVFVRRAAGIRTFFPDATPDFNRNPVCANPIVLAQRIDNTGDVSSSEQASEDKESEAQSLTVGRFKIEVISADETGVTLRISEGE